MRLHRPVKIALLAGRQFRRPPCVVGRGEVLAHRLWYSDRAVAGGGSVHGGLLCAGDRRHYGASVGSAGTLVTPYVDGCAFVTESR